MRRLFAWSLLPAAALAQAEVAVPLTLDHGIPVVQLTIAGVASPFTFDIGSSRTVHLTRDVMARIPGLQLTGRKLKSLDLTGKVQEEDEFTIPDLVVNGVSFGPVTGVAYAPWGLNIGRDAEQPHHSVIGLGLFARQPFVYDHAGRVLRFGAPLSPGQGWQPLPYEKAHEGIVARFSSARATYRLVFDTGSNISLVKPQSVRAQHDVPGPCTTFGPDTPCESIAVSLPGGPQWTPYLLPLPAEFAPDGLAGTDFFAHYAVYVDLAQGKLALRPAVE